MAASAPTAVTRRPSGAPVAASPVSSGAPVPVTPVPPASAGATVIDTPMPSGAFAAAGPVSPGAPIAPPAASKKRPKWMPFAIAGAAAAVVVAVVLVMTLQPGGGGGGGGGVQAPAPAPAASTSSNVQSPASGSAPAKEGMYYLAVSDGKVAIFTNSSAEPYRVTDMQASDLPADARGEVDGHISFASVADAENKVDEYRAAAKAAADEEAARKAAEEEAARKAAEEEAARKAAEEAARNTWYVCASDFVTLRSAPDIKATALERIYCRDAVEYVEDVGGGWSCIRHNGTTGYVITKFISPDSNAALVYDDV